MLLVGLLLVLWGASEARGPHHPRGAPVKFVEDRHFHHESEHLEEDLGLARAPKKVTDMTQDEKNFYYFKLHDLDNNNNLDGLEMLNAATHHEHGGEGVRGEEGPTEEEIGHIVEVIDDFIAYADLDNNGFLNYPEYIRAINSTNEVSRPT